MNSDEEHVSMATSLVNPNDAARQAAIDGIRNYIASIKEVSDMDMLKLWKGLYYSLWLCDKTAVQNQLAEEISKFIHVIKKKETVVQYVTIFARTLLREWALLDQYRVNKFYNLLRFIVRECFVYLKRASWRTTEVDMLLTVIDGEFLKKIPNGPRFHIIDIYLEELVNVAGADISNSQFLTVLHMFFTTLRTGSEMLIVDRVLNSICRKYLEQFAVENKNEVGMDISSNSSNSSNSKYFVHVKTKSLQKLVFDIASSAETSSTNRKKLYDIHKLFPAVTGVQFVENDEGEEEAEEGAAKVKQTPKKSRKIDEISTPVAETPKSQSKDKEGKAKSVSSTPVVEVTSESKTKKSKLSSESKITPVPTPPVAEKAPASASKIAATSSATATTTIAKKDTKPIVESKIPVPKKSALKTSTSTIPPTTSTSASTAEPVVAAAAAVAPSGDASSAVKEPFIATKKFTGNKSGYIFTTGKQGTGYYLDSLKLKANSKAGGSRPASSASSTAAGAKSKGVTFGKNQVARFSVGK